MTDEGRNHEALFRHAILGDVLSRILRRGQLRPALKQLAEQSYQDHHGRPRRVAYKTLEEWFYKYRSGGFDALKPRPRSGRRTPPNLRHSASPGRGREASPTVSQAVRWMVQSAIHYERLLPWS